MKMNPVHFTNQYDLPRDLYLWGEWNRMLAYTPKTAITRNPPETNFIECLVSGLHCSVTHGPQDPARHVLFLHLTISFLLCSFRSIPTIDQPAVSIPDIHLSHGKDLVITLVAKTDPGQIVTERNKMVWAWKTNTWTCLPKNSNLFICFSYKKRTWNLLQIPKWTTDLRDSACPVDG